MVTNLTFLRRPMIGLGARAAHQHRSLTVAEAVSLEEGLDGLLVVDDGVRACPVRAPQAALETPGIEQRFRGTTWQLGTVSSLRGTDLRQDPSRPTLTPMCR